MMCSGGTGTRARGATGDAPDADAPSGDAPTCSGGLAAPRPGLAAAAAAESGSGLPRPTPSGASTGRSSGAAPLSLAPRRAAARCELVRRMAARSGLGSSPLSDAAVKMSRG